MKRGLFITFEGVEGSGKSTQIREAVRFFKSKKRKVLRVREPGATRIGEKIRSILLDQKHLEMTTETELLLYLAARAQMVREVVRPALRNGVVVISDRFEDSTVAYQVFGGGLKRGTIAPLLRFACEKLVPDITFVMDVKPEIGLRRSGRGDRMEKKSVAFHERVRKGFLSIARSGARGRVVVIETNRPRKQVAEKIKKVLHDRFG